MPVMFDQAKCWEYLQKIKDPALNQYQLDQIQILFNLLEQYQPIASPIIGYNDDGISVYAGITWLTKQPRFVATVEVHAKHTELYMVISRNQLVISEDVVDLGSNSKLETMISFTQSEMLAANVDPSDQ